MSLHKQKCVPCEGGEPKISIKDAIVLNKAVPKWKIVNKHHLVGNINLKILKNSRICKFCWKNCRKRRSPSRYNIKMGLCKIKLFTHAIRGLHQNDFIIAAKIDKL